MFRSRTLFKLCILAATGMASSAAMAQTTFDEATFNAEPNNTKAAATSVVTIGVAGDKLTGTVSSTDTDYWHLRLAPAAPLGAGLYRNVLTVTAPTSGTFTHTIRGLNQASGVIGSTDTAVFTSTVSSSTARSVSWVGFGKQEELFYAISFSTATATPYTVTYARAAITPIDMTANSLNAGPITIRVHNVSGSLNTDCWLYDSNLNPLTNDATAGPAGADGALAPVGGGTGTNLSSFTRTLPAGVYYLAIAGSNLANTQPSVAADTTGFNSPVLELPNSLVCGVSTGSAATFYADFVDSATPTAHTVTSTNFVLAASWGGNVNFVKINVIQPFLPSGILSSTPTPAVPGSSTVLSVAVTPGTGGASADITSVSADISALTSTPPTTINLSSSDGGVTWTGTAPVDLATTQGNKTIPFTVVEGGSVPGTLNSSGTVTVGPMNDMCSGAIAVNPGTPSSPIDNSFAGTNDGPNACAAGGKGIWYKVTPTADASYQIDTCGSAGNTLLTVYQIGSCGDTATWTQLGCNDDRPAGTCIEAQTSAVQNVGLLAGTTYYLRVQALNNSGTFITGNVVVNVTQTGTVGACCSNTTGACTFTSPAACTGTTISYLGDGTSCTPLPCTITGTCCNNSTGACTTLGSTGTCATGTTSNSSLACSPTPCAVSGTCCNNTSGACATIFGGSCAAGSIGGSGTVCDSSACIAIGTCCNTTTSACTALFGGNCPTGTSAGAGNVCNASACVAIGTCCSTSNGTCTSLYSGSCASGTTSNASLTCSPTPCTPSGICCSTGGICTVNYGATCSGTLNSAVTACGTGSPNSACPPVGICCLFASGSCTVLYGGSCLSNASFHTDTACTTGTPSPTCAPYAVGTCCSSTGSCSVIFGGTCAGASGITGTTCSAGTPSPSCAATGICCNNSTGACALIFSGACGTGGTAGAGTSCGTGACPVAGACCDSLTGTCRLIYGGTCPSGSQAAAGTACDAAACPPIGSCCDNTTGVCVLEFGSCPNNSTPNPSLVCTPTPCLPAQMWACCLPDASCRATTQDDCVGFAGGWAPGLTCGSFVCSPTNLVLNLGAETSDLSSWTTTGGWSATFDAVIHSGYRSFATSSSLGTRTQTINLVARGYTAGVLDALPPIVVGDWIASRSDQGVNYFVQFDLLDATQAVLATYSHGSSTSLTALPANTPFLQEAHTFTGYPTGVRSIKITEGGRDQSGWAGFYGAHFDDAFAGVVVLQACCLAGGSCIVEDMATCLDAGGTRTATTTCTPTTCGQSGGVCCRGATCNASFAAANCTGNGLAGAVDSVSASCNAGGSTTTPCCYPDYNKTGGITVGDIFDFLNDWFAGSPYANFGGNGAAATLAVQNIFDFLNAWFAGGC